MADRLIHDLVDIRFTTNSGMLYAIALGWPEEGKLVIESLGAARHSTRITGVELVGNEGESAYGITIDGLEISVPKQKPCEHACVFRILR